MSPSITNPDSLSEQRLSELKERSRRDPAYLTRVATAVRRIAPMREHAVAKTDDHDDDCTCHVGRTVVCLGPGRCESLGAAGPCEWCIPYPADAGADYADTFLLILERGN